MSKSATDELRHEHEVVLVVVGAMEAEAVAVRAGDPHAERIAQMVDFTKNFTDGCHHAKEEKALFPLLEDSAPEAGGPVSVMLSEHEAGRQAIRAIEGALPDVETSAAARDTVATGLATYAHLLRLHIRKENEILFPHGRAPSRRRRQARAVGRVRAPRAGGDRRGRARALPRAGARARLHSCLAGGGAGGGGPARAEAAGEDVVLPGRLVSPCPLRRRSRSAPRCRRDAATSAGCRRSPTGGRRGRGRRPSSRPRRWGRAVG